MNTKKLLLVGFIFSGIAALIYELTWIRPLQFLLGSTIYTISLIFAVFMLGLALGSLIVSKYIENIKNLPLAYALIELGIGLYGVLLLSIFNLLPGIYNLLYPLHVNFYLFEFVHFILIFIILLIPTTLMRASFPIVAKFYTQEKIGKGIGEIYSANNLGAIIGSFGTGFILIPLIGIKGSIILAGIINLSIGFSIIFITEKKLVKKIIPFFLILFILFAYFGNYNIQQMHSGGFYRTNPEIATMGNVVYYQEGLYATVTVRELPVTGHALFINGYGQGDDEISDLRVNFLLAYLPNLIKPEIKNALLIGLGTGTTAGQLSQLINTTTVEIEPAIVEATNYFGIFNQNVLENKNHTLILSDARNYLLKNTEKYDLIVAEPTNTWQSFSTQLYSKEFFELVKTRLNDEGLFVKWIPIYTMGIEDFQSLYKTFNSAFPYTVAFVNIKADEDTPIKFESSQIILIGSKEKIEMDENKLKMSYNSLPDLSKQYLDALKLNSGEKIYHLLLFTGEQMINYGKSAELILDDKPILEFSTAKKALNQNPKAIIENINNFLQKNE